MDARAAKRRVCRDAAMILENALASNDPGTLTDVDGPDEDRLNHAWSDLIKELDRRSLGR
jgi:hypothetical protein